MNKWVQSQGDFGVYFLTLLLFGVTITGMPLTIFIMGGGYVLGDLWPVYGVWINMIASFIGSTAGSFVAFYMGR